MTENAMAKKPILQGFKDDFKALTTKQIIAIIAAVIVSLVLEVIGFTGICCVGFLVIAVVLYMIPHMTGLMSVRVKAILGLMFIIPSLLIGTFAYGGVVEDYEDLLYQDNDNSSIRHADIVFEEGAYVATFEVNPDKAFKNLDPKPTEWGAKVTMDVVSMIAFSGVMVEGESTEYKVKQSDTVEIGDGWYRVSVILDSMTGDELYLVSLSVDEIVQKEGEDPVWRPCGGRTCLYNTGVSSGDITMINFKGAAYVTALTAVVFYLILALTTLMRMSAEKTRKKMEGEGRLYPKGYGLCKKCGTTVLPGEVVCRKCGEYIEVPEELKRKKVDFFTCSECGAEVPSDAKTCPKCGASFDESDEVTVEHSDGTVEVTEDVVECPHCKENIPANADWCPKCGKKIKE